MSTSKILKNITLNETQIIGTPPTPPLLVDIRLGYSYINGTRSTEPDHTKYDVVLQNHGYAKLSVKIAGSPLISKEQLIASNGSLKVKFKNLTGKIYYMPSTGLGISASADGIEVIA